MSILVFLEHHGDQVQTGSLGVLSKAVALGQGDVAAVMVGAGVKPLASGLGRFGVAQVHVADDDGFEPPLPQPRVDVLADVVGSGGYDTVLFSNSVLAADIAAGLAARLDAGLNWDLVDIESRNGDLVGKRLALGDSILVDVGWSSAPRLALFRNGSFEVTEVGDEAQAPSEPRVIDVEVRLQGHSQVAKIVEQRLQPAEGPSLGGADVIVAGGMGLGGAEKFVLAEELAQALGGVVGATRAAVYAGWYPHSAQIGQTGQIVSPRLYIALGISGAIQHKVGMQSSKVIVAINTDSTAPVFEFSDLAVVGDVHAIVPKLTELVRQRRAT